MTDLSRLTVGDFEPRVGEPFTLADGTVFELVEAVPAGAGGPRGASFSLTFAGPADPVRPQGMLSLTNEQLGTLELFLVPVERDASAVRYQAIFN